MLGESQKENAGKQAAEEVIQSNSSELRGLHLHRKDPVLAIGHFHILHREISKH